MESYFTEVIVKLLRQGHSIEIIEEALRAELLIVQKVKPFLTAKEESNLSP